MKLDTASVSTFHLQLDEIRGDPLNRLEILFNLVINPLMEL